MSSPTYEELVAEVARLRAKLSVGEDKEFTAEIKSLMPSEDLLANDCHVRNDRITIRPAEMWSYMFKGDPSTRDLAKLGRSLQARGWARSAKRGNLVFTIPVEEYEH
jgi:hypothetical protein